MAEPNFLEKTVTFLRPVLPRRFRGDIPVVPVVRLSGVIGLSSPLRPGLTLANVATPLMLLPPLTLNDADGKPSAEAEAILRGGATIPI